MNRSIELLRSADPAAEFHIEAIGVSFNDIAERAAHDSCAHRLPRRSRQRQLQLFAVCGAAVAAVVLPIVGPPGTTGDSVAYGVTSQPDGTVDVRLSNKVRYNPLVLQAQLRAAGVHAVVLVESPGTQCHQVVNGVPSPDVLLPSDRSGDVWVINPRAMLPGETVVVTLPFPGEYGRSEETKGFGSIEVTRQTPPTCAPQLEFVTAVPTGGLRPSSGASGVASSIPRPVTSGG